MIDILTTLHKYVPYVAHLTKRQISTGEVITEEKATMHRIIVGGDQLTAARIRGAQRAKFNGETPSKRLEGIIAAAEDWHTKANFLGVSQCMHGNHFSMDYN